MRMLSALGRTEVCLVELPWCHALFSLGMCASILGIFAKGSNLAFAGYAAVALGLRGDGDTADFSGGIAWIPLCRCD